MAAQSSDADALQTGPLLGLVVGIEIDNYVAPVTHKLHLASPHLQLKVLLALTNLIDIADAKGLEGCQKFKDAMDTATDVVSNLLGKAGPQTRQSPKQLRRQRTPNAMDPLDLNDISLLDEHEVSTVSQHGYLSTQDGCMRDLDKFKARSTGELGAMSFGDIRNSAGKREWPPRRPKRRPERVAPMDFKAFSQENTLPTIRPPRFRREKRRPSTSDQSSLSLDTFRPRTDGELPEFRGVNLSTGPFQDKPLCSQNQHRVLSHTQQGARSSASDGLPPGSSTEKMRPQTEGELPLSKLDHDKLLDLEADLESSEGEDQLMSNTDSEGEDSKQVSLRKHDKAKCKAEVNSKFEIREPGKARRMFPADYAKLLPDGMGALKKQAESLEPKQMPRVSRVCPMDLSGWKASGAASTESNLRQNPPSSILRPQSGGVSKPRARTDGEIQFLCPDAELDSSDEEEEGVLSNTDSEDANSQGPCRSKNLASSGYASVQFDATELQAIQEALYSSQQSADEESDRAPQVYRVAPMDLSGFEIRPPQETFQSELERPRSRGRLLSISRHAPCPNSIVRPNTDSDLPKVVRDLNSNIALDPGEGESRQSDKDSSGNKLEQA